MTVKFLYPHLNRGDLYTKQGILSMLQAGIKVILQLLCQICSTFRSLPTHSTLFRFSFPFPFTFPLEIRAQLCIATREIGL